MVLLDFRIIPIGEGISLSPYVAESLDIIDRSGLDYRCHAMGTTLEGDFDAVMGAVRECFDAMTGECDRMVCSIEIDYRKDRDRRLEGKVASIERQLGRALRK